MNDINPASQVVFYIDGKEFSSLEEFFERIGALLRPGTVKGWIHSFDAFNDFLYDEDLPSEGFTLVWTNSALSAANLGYPETIRQLELSLSWVHPVNITTVLQRIELAKESKGPTMFDEILDVLRGHDEIKLVLE
jgi:hypothetical protein